MESIKELRKICQAPGDRHNPESILDEKIWRVPSIYITKLLLYTPIKPDHVTMLMVFWGFLVGFLFSIGTYSYMIAGAIVLEFLYVLDAVDGEMARYKKTSSLNGVFLDLVAHLTNIAIPFMGITIGIYKLNPDICLILAGLSASVFSVLCLNIQTMKHHVIFKKLCEYAQETGQIKSKKINKKIITESTKRNTLKSMFKTINSTYDQVFVMQIILFGAIFNKLHWVLIFYGLTFPLVWLLKLVHEYREDYNSYAYLFKPYNK